MNSKKTRTTLIVASCVLALMLTAWIAAYIETNRPETVAYYKHGNIDLEWKLTAQDSLLFDFNKVKFSLPFRLRTSDLRNDIRTIGVHNNMGFINYTSIDIRENLSLDDIIIEPRKRIPKIKGQGIMGIMTQLSQEGVADSVILSYIGTSGQLKEYRHGDNFRSYTVYTKTLSIRYGKNELPDMSINQATNIYRPFSFAFLKKGGLLFFIEYGVNIEKVSTEEALRTDYLGDMIKWESYD